MDENCCFSKNSRLRKPAEFNTVYQNNQTRTRGQYFMVLAFSRVNDEDGDAFSAMSDTARLGAVVSKKVSKLAVRRNRVKRLIRDRFRHFEHPETFDFVVIAKPLADKVDNVKLIQELNYLWKKTHQRCAN